MAVITTICIGQTRLSIIISQIRPARETTLITTIARTLALIITTLMAGILKDRRINMVTITITQAGNLRSKNSYI